MVRLLWPEPARISVPGGSSSPGAARTTTYRVLPSLERPKLVLPASPRRIAASALRNFKTVSTVRTRATINFLSGAVRVGAADLVLPRITVDYDAGAVPADIESYLSDVLGRPVRVSVHLSAPRAVRKPVLQVLDDRGATLAFAKIGVDAFTRELVRAEGDAVSFLSSVRWTQLTVPTVLHLGSWGEHVVLVQSALGRGRSAAIPEVPTQAMRELARVHGVQSAPLGQSTYWHRLLERLDALPESTFRASIDEFMKHLERTNRTTELEFGSWHGDWAPWNMVVVADEVRVWDWEKFETDVPLGFDAVHFDVQAAVVMSGAPPTRAFRHTMDHASDLLPPHGPSPDSAVLVVALYAADLAVRYLEDGEPDAGTTAMSQLGSWLDDVLRDATTRCTVVQLP